MRQQPQFFSIFKASPLFIAVSVAVVVVFGLSFVQYARRGGFWSPEVEARVFTSEGSKRAGEAVDTGERRFIFQGEVYSDVERLREAAAIAVGGMLLAADGRLNGRAIQTVEGLFAEMSAAGIVPPGVEVDQTNKRMVSTFGNYYVRYRQSPLGVEVVSECAGQLCGPALLVRLPDDGFSQGALTYYSAPSTGRVAVPGAFASTVEVIKSGWRPQTFRAQINQPETGK